MDACAKVVKKRCSFKGVTIKQSREEFVSRMAQRDMSIFAATRDVTIAAKGVCMVQW